MAHDITDAGIAESQWFKAITNTATHQDQKPVEDRDQNEIASTGCARAFDTLMGLEDIVGKLQETVKRNRLKLLCPM